MNPAELFRKETDVLQLAPGDFLFREGDKGDKMYVLLEGEIDIPWAILCWRPQGQAH